MTNKGSFKELPESGEGRVLAVTRRSVRLLIENEAFKGVSSTENRDLIVGDSVSYEKRGQEIFITERGPRKNELTRSFGETLKCIAVNLDRVYLITSILPRFQPLFVDKILASARIQEIEASLVIHKSDLGLDATKELLEIYRDLGVEILVTSARSEGGLDPLIDSLTNPCLSIVALFGVSGVGKSTILNALIPEATRETQEVSARSGTGKQTTSQSHAYPYHSAMRNSPLLIIDLPGVQNYGVGHFTKEEIVRGFIEIERVGAKCPFDNCSHINEEECEVRAAVETREIYPTRYLSYLRMQEEVQQAKPW